MMPAPPCVSVIALDRYWDHSSARRTPTGELVFRAKYEGSAAATDQVLGYLAYWLECIHEHRPPFGEFSAVAPIPPRSRGDEHSGVLGGVCAAVASEVLGVPLLVDALRECKAHAPLKRVPVEERPDVMAGVFEMIRPVSGPILLVDDVVQTGATLSAGAHALLRSGAREVQGLALARAEKGMAP